MQTKTQENKKSKDEQLIESIKNVSLKELLLFLISEKILNQKKINWNGDIEGNLKQEIEESIKEKYQDINEKVSEIRKSGKDLGVLNFKLMMLPLKIKVFLSTYEKKDAENLLRRMQEIEKEIGSTKR